VGLAAFAGSAPLFVHRRPRVGVLSTGDELLDSLSFPNPAVAAAASTAAAATFNASAVAAAAHAAVSAAGGEGGGGEGGRGEGGGGEGSGGDGGGGLGGVAAVAVNAGVGMTAACPPPGRVYDSNRPALLAAVAAEGGVPTDLGLATDETGTLE